MFGSSSGSGRTPSLIPESSWLTRSHALELRRRRRSSGSWFSLSESSCLFDRLRVTGDSSHHAGVLVESLLFSLRTSASSCIYVVLIETS